MEIVLYVVYLSFSLVQKLYNFRETTLKLSEYVFSILAAWITLFSPLKCGQNKCRFVWYINWACPTVSTRKSDHYGTMREKCDYSEKVKIEQITNTNNLLSEIRWN